MINALQNKFHCIKLILILISFVGINPDHHDASQKNTSPRSQEPIPLDLYSQILREQGNNILIVADQNNLQRFRIIVKTERGVFIISESFGKIKTCLVKNIDGELTLEVYNSPLENLYQNVRIDDKDSFNQIFDLSKGNLFERILKMHICYSIILGESLYKGVKRILYPFIIKPISQKAYFFGTNVIIPCYINPAASKIQELYSYITSTIRRRL